MFGKRRKRRVPSWFLDWGLPFIAVVVIWLGVTTCFHVVDNSCYTRGNSMTHSKVICEWRGVTFAGWALIGLGLSTLATHGIAWPSRVNTVFRRPTIPLVGVLGSLGVFTIHIVLVVSDGVSLVSDAGSARCWLAFYVATTWPYVCMGAFSIYIFLPGLQSDRRQEVISMVATLCTCTAIVAPLFTYLSSNSLNAGLVAIACIAAAAGLWSALINCSSYGDRLDKLIGATLEQSSLQAHIFYLLRTWIPSLGVVGIVIMLGLAIMTSPWARLGILVAGHLWMSAVTIACYAIDKYSAAGGYWRLSERQLHSFALFWGWPGAEFGQRYLRQKSRKLSFQRTHRLVRLGSIALTMVVAFGGGVVRMIAAGEKT